MTSQLFVDFPELANLSYVFAALPHKRIVMAQKGNRRQDLEDLLTDQEYFQTIFMGLPRVQSMLQSLVELGRANESIASASPHIIYGHLIDLILYREEPGATGGPLQASRRDTAGI
jgi:hypothetical protein